MFVEVNSRVLKFFLPWEDRTGAFPFIPQRFGFGTNRYVLKAACRC
ncbi:hypothetical protein Psta_0272 [Pirellula staleyi DSM 6068]|uniref:Uncharacterized protein n=1 Tax=Pirellula staleyi (strain ATCC 27377 / DSM 6068 / ICPB 4128) TaxID=530564 RepID=D2R1I2_PIRSD|nr:hypothetical protein Psta_0272 [Pirellula staleyi DSM 6068]